MTENLKLFVEFVSAQDKETLDQVSQMKKDELIAYAAEKGFVLTEADFEEQEDDDEMSSDEMTTVAGGSVCACPALGLGLEGGKDKSCSCGIAGWGKDNCDEIRCVCPIAGGGKSRN